MPKKIPPPNATITVTFRADKLRISSAIGCWCVRAQQITAIGHSWVTIASVKTHTQALAVAATLTNNTHHTSNGITIEQKEKE